MLIAIHLVFLANLWATFAGKIIQTTTGLIEETTISPGKREIDAFFGIPFAEPPLGQLRFSDPVPKRSWGGVYSATKKAPACPQNAEEQYFFMADKNYMSEDCLYLNIWAPKITPRGKLKSIIIWIHGGAFTYGSANMQIYDGAMLAGYGDTIVASMNYRLGALGYYAHFDETFRGCMGCFDMILAINWIKNNAKEFGGDPKEITLMGESAGSMVIPVILASPLTRHLAKRGIMESGGSVLPFFTDDNNKRLRTMAKKLVKSIGCVDKNKNLTLEKNPKLVVDCLRNKSLEEIMRADTRLAEDLRVSFFPSLNSTITDKPLAEYLKEGDFPTSEILMGISKEEGTFLISFLFPYYFGRYGKDNIQRVSQRFASQMIRSMFLFTTQKNQQEIAEYYTNSIRNGTAEDYTKAIAASLGDYMVSCGSIFQADLMSLPSKTSVYFYMFTHRSSQTLFAPWVGATHLEEIPYVFGEPLHEGSNFTGEEVTLSRRTMDRWIAFAKTGNPNIPGEINWPRYRYEDPKYLDINIEEMVHTKPLDGRCEFWRERFDVEIDGILFNKLRNHGIFLAPNILIVFLFVCLSLLYPLISAV